MRKFYSSVLLGIAKLTFLFCLFTAVAIAQTDVLDPREGTEHWFAIPNCGSAVGEQVRWDNNSPILVWVSSRTNTNFTISSADGYTVPATTYNVVPGTITKVNLPQEIMLSMADNEIPTNKGIRIVSDEPVSVGVFIAFKWSGEAFRVIPADWLGSEYYTINLWQDKMKMASGGEPELKPAEFVIVATSEGTTTIQYTPRVHTPHTSLGETKTITLTRGQTYLVHAATNEAISWNTERSDLTGSHITGNKPFAVLSGHTKGTFPQYPATMYGIKTDFIRNMMMEMMWPLEHLSFDYVSAPLKYNVRNYSNAVPNERGDLIRFVATYPNTVVKEKVFNTETQTLEYVPVSDTLQPGQFFDIPNRETPGYFVSNKRFMAAQFGKAWIDHLPSPKVNSENGEKPGDGEIQNPSRCGQGMMMVLAPYQKWVSYAAFNMIPGMTGDYIYLTFETADIGNILFDDQPISQRFSSSIQTIPGTIFSYIVQNISPGDHVVTGSNDARFACYCYGVYDAYKDGFAYGYPTGINYATSCPDSIAVSDTLIGGTIYGECRLLNTTSADTTCLGFWRVALNESDSSNVEFKSMTTIEDNSTVYKFSVKTINPLAPANAKILFRTKSGRGLKKEFAIEPDMTSAHEDAGASLTSLYVVTPNPVNKKATIRYSVGSGSQNVSIVLYDALGNQIARLVDANKPAGVYSCEVDTDAMGLANGNYYYKMICGSFTKTMPLVVTK